MMGEIPEDIRKTAADLYNGLTCEDPVRQIALAILEERERWTFSKQVIRMMAYFYTNTNRWDLEAAGIIPEGPSGDMLWKRFNHNFDVFILKLSDDKQEALAALMSKYIFPDHPAIPTEPVERKAIEAAES